MCTCQICRAEPQGIYAWQRLNKRNSSVCRMSHHVHIGKGGILFVKDNRVGKRLDSPCKA